MIRGPGDGALDLRAVRRDDELLDSLGRRGPGDPGDPVSLLLAALAVDVDHGIAELVSTPLPGAAGADVATVATVLARPDLADRDGGDEVADEVAHGVADEVAGGVADDRADGLAGRMADDAHVAGLVDHDPRPHDIASARRRRRTAYGAAAALVLGATFSVSGVAAAVTGDPFAPYRAVGGALSWGEDDLPPNAAQIAHLNKRLARARAAIAHGELAGVQERIDALRAGLDDLDLTDGQRNALERKLDRLEAAAARAGADGKNVPAGQGTKAPGTKGEKATGRDSATTGGAAGGGSTGGEKTTGRGAGAKENTGSGKSTDADTSTGGGKSTGGDAGGRTTGGKAGKPTLDTGTEPGQGETSSTGSTSGTQKQTGTGAGSGDEDDAAAADKGSDAAGKKG